MPWNHDGGGYLLTAGIVRGKLVGVWVVYDVGVVKPVMSTSPTEPVPQRYPKDRPLHEDLGSWCVMHVKPNCEKKVAAYLRNRDIGYYLPLYVKKRNVGYFRRIRTTEVPLFRGYLCVVLGKGEQRCLYGSGTFLRIIQVEDQDRFVRELGAVARAIETEDDLILRPGLAPGKSAVILSGPLKGMEGVIVGRNPSRRLALSVQMFNQTVLVRLDPLVEVEPR
jgi:hypothetical protein